MRSKLFKLNARDLLKGSIVAILTGFLTTLVNGISFNKESLTIIATAMVSSLAAYLLKNMTTNSDGQILTPEKASNEN